MTKKQKKHVDEAARVLSVLRNRLESEICQALMVENIQLAERLNHHLVESKKAAIMLKAAS